MISSNKISCYSKIGEQGYNSLNKICVYKYNAKIEKIIYSKFELSIIGVKETLTVLIMINFD